jgi:N-acetylglucosaminyl-diphospho-decaprenol L-rhamnosyltransferase
VQPTIGVVIVNYNAGPHLARCLGSVRTAFPATSIRTVVVDNGSVDGSQRAASTLSVDLVEVGANLGFARAANLGASRTDAELLLFLNPDAWLRRGALDLLLETLHTSTSCAVVAPGIVDDDDSPQGNARGDPDMLTGLFGRSSALRRWLPESGLARRNVLAQPASPVDGGGHEVDWVSGACMLVRREAFDQVEGFDERYFLYWEDADLCRRLANRGLTTRYVPGARVSHPGGLSAGTSRAFATRAFHRSAYLYYSTHVVPSPWHPMRWFAKIALTLRATWRVARGR